MFFFLNSFADFVLNILNRESGLFGLTGSSDFRDVSTGFLAGNKNGWYQSKLIQSCFEQQALGF